jgi:hypothetical protein
MSVEIFTGDQSAADRRSQRFGTLIDALLERFIVVRATAMPLPVRLRLPGIPPRGHNQDQKRQRSDIQEV